MLKGACMAKGGMHGKEGGMHGEVRHAWLERRPLQRAVRILLECTLVDYISVPDIFYL